MKADHLTYTRAAIISLWGLAIQIAMGLALLIYSLSAKSGGADHATFYGAVFVLFGVPVWLTLAIVFDQHRRERLEALEAETLDAASSREASAFASSSEDLRVAARRLAFMHRFLVPAVSLLLGVGLVAIAYYGFTTGLGRVGFEKTGDQFVKPKGREWAIAIGISLAVIGFVFARFVSGMAKQRVWANLRGGAAYVVGTSLIGVALVVAQFIDVAGSDLALRYLQLVIPAFAGLIGVEIFVSFLLNLYRPRKPGEVPRAAFDSPILSFVASPDRIAKTIGEAISYQFGVDVTGSWAYRVVARSVALLVLFGGVVLWALTVVSVVGAGERGLLIRNGAFVRVVGPGLHLKWPWPIEVIDRYNVGVNVGSDGSPGMNLANAPPGSKVGVILWTNEHNKDESYSIVKASASASSTIGTSATSSGDDGTRDVALIKTEIPLIYMVKDVTAFEQFAAADTREELIKAIAQREIWPYLATLSEDDLLGPKRDEASTNLSKRVQAALDRAKTGVEIVFCGIEGVHPPRETAEAYEKVVNTSVIEERVTDEARAEEIQTLTNAAGGVQLARQIVGEINALTKLQDQKVGEQAIGEQERKIDDLLAKANGKAGQTLSTAKSDRWQRHMTERGRAEAYTGQIVAYRANPELFKASLYFTTLAEAVSGVRLYLVPDDIPDLRPVIDLKDQGGADAFTPSSGN